MLVTNEKTKQPKYYNLAELDKFMEDYDVYFKKRMEEIAAADSGSNPPTPPPPPPGSKP